MFSHTDIAVSEICAKAAHDSLHTSLAIFFFFYQQLLHLQGWALSSESSLQGRSIHQVQLLCALI